MVRSAPAEDPLPDLVGDAPGGIPGRLSHANMVEALFLCGPSANESARVTATVL
ncbi:MAG: hypothetical protein JW940_20705 [Polyangiaceae bacterium]|nr:hypothetical protein [Polyangiaceae bacterium]